MSEYYEETIRPGLFIDEKGEIWKHGNCDNFHWSKFDGIDFVFIRSDEPDYLYPLEGYLKSIWEIMGQKADFRCWSGGSNPVS